jgi:eukaryotic-like serine/threonine-protein kinase
MGCNEKVDRECSDDEKPGRQVSLDAYSIDKYEVTVAEYGQCVEAGKCSSAGLTGSRFCNWGQKKRTDHPINCVDWSQASAYCEWAGKRLPTEAEWEKAARGTDGRIYPWGNQWDAAKANIGSPGTVAVGSYPAGVSPYEVHDMAGNVWEWVQDWYDGTYYRGGSVRNPQGPSSGKERVVRGGSWVDNPWGVRVADRYWFTPGYRVDYIGFRCAR